MDLFCTQILKKQFFVKIRNLDVIVISLYVVALVSQNTIVLIILVSGGSGFRGWGRDVGLNVDPRPEPVKPPATQAMTHLQLNVLNFSIY